MSTTVHDDLGDVHIVTNNVPRPIIPVIYERDEGWVKATGDEDETSIGFEYRGFVYALQEFSITRGLPAGSPFMQFDAFQPSSYFDGIAIRYTHDFDSVVVAYVHW